MVNQVNRCARALSKITLDFIINLSYFGISVTWILLIIIRNSVVFTKMWAEKIEAWVGFVKGK